MTLTLGIDFDNTLVCYDEVFHRVAVEQGLVPADTAPTKEAVRDRLRRTGREEAWTALQGCVYGRHMAEAAPFPGAVAFLREARRRRVFVAIVSHKTRLPYRGPPVDLHDAALAWLRAQGFFDPGSVGLTRDQVFFLESKQEKLHQIGRLGCSHFVDDLPEVLLAEEFPPGTERLLFAPKASPELAGPLVRVRSWGEIQRRLQGAWEQRS